MIRNRKTNNTLYLLFVDERSLSFIFLLCIAILFIFRSLSLFILAVNHSLLAFFNSLTFVVVVVVLCLCYLSFSQLPSGTSHHFQGGDIDNIVWVIFFVYANSWTSRKAEQTPDRMAEGKSWTSKKEKYKHKN